MIANELENRITAALSIPHARCREPNALVWELGMGPWWKYFDDWKGLNEARYQVLLALWESGHTVFLVPPDEPPRADILAFLEYTPPAWHVRTTIDPDPFLQSDLSEGRWFLYVADQPVPREEISDTTRFTVAAIQGYLEQYQMYAFVDCLRPGNDWLIAVNSKTDIMKSDDTPQRPRQ